MRYLIITEFNEVFYLEEIFDKDGKLLECCRTGLIEGFIIIVDTKNIATSYDVGDDDKPMWVDIEKYEGN